MPDMKWAGRLHATGMLFTQLQSIPVRSGKRIYVFCWDARGLLRKVYNSRWSTFTGVRRVTEEGVLVRHDGRLFAAGRGRLLGRGAEQEAARAVQAAAEGGGVEQGAQSLARHVDEALGALLRRRVLEQPLDGPAGAAQAVLGLLGDVPALCEARRGRCSPQMRSARPPAPTHLSAWPARRCPCPPPGRGGRRCRAPSARPGPARWRCRCPWSSGADRSSSGSPSLPPYRWSCGSWKIASLSPQVVHRFNPNTNPEGKLTFPELNWTPVSNMIAMIMLQW